MREVNKPIPVSEHTWRAAAAKVRAFIKGQSVEQVLHENYPDDQVTPIIARAVSHPAILTDPAWAGPLAALSVSEAVQDSVSMSILGRLMMAGGLHIDLGKFASVVVPGRSTTIADAGQWVAEGAPIPAKQHLLLGPTLRPRKLAVIATFTQELADASNIEAILRALIIEAAGPAVDAAILSNAAASPQKSAGLIYGLTPLVPASGTFGFDNCGQDLGKMVGDIAARNGGAHTVFAANPAQATAIRFYAGGQFAIDPRSDVLPVAGSAALPTGTIIAIEPSSFASTIGAPEFEVGTVATIHQEDTTPSDIFGSTGTPAYPTKSMWQVDAIALKMTVWCDWCMRAPHVSFMNAVTW
jgi:hypothetical protein